MEVQKQVNERGHITSQSGKKAKPALVKLINAGPLTFRLKRWEDGSHFIEFSYPTGRTDAENRDIWVNSPAIGLSDASSIADALTRLRTLGLAREDAEQ